MFLYDVQCRRHIAGRGKHWVQAKNQPIDVLWTAIGLLVTVVAAVGVTIAIAQAKIRKAVQSAGLSSVHDAIPALSYAVVLSVAKWF